MAERPGVCLADRYKSIKSKQRPLCGKLSAQGALLAVAFSCRYTCISDDCVCKKQPCRKEKSGLYETWHPRRARFERPRRLGGGPSHRPTQYLLSTDSPPMDARFQGIEKDELPRLRFTGLQFDLLGSAVHHMGVVGGDLFHKVGAGRSFKHQ